MSGGGWQVEGAIRQKERWETRRALRRDALHQVADTRLDTSAR